MMKNKRIEWIDALKGFGILLVIVGHIPTIPDWLFKLIYGFHMPLFFIISGYLFNSVKWHELGFINFIKSKSRSLLIPFLILSIIVFILEISKLLIFSNVIYWEEFSKYIFDYLRWILFQIDGDFCGSQIAGLWFIPTLFFSSIFLFLIINKNKMIKILFCAVSFILIKIQCYYAFTTIPWHLDTALLGTIYMLFGYYIKKYQIINGINNILVVICMLLISILCIYFNGPVDLKNRIYSNLLLMFIGACLFTLFLFWIFNKYSIKSSFLIYFGKYSLLIVAFNFVFNNVLNKLFQVVNIDCHWAMFTIIEIFGFYLFLLIFNNVLNKHKKLSILTGNRY